MTTTRDSQDTWQPTSGLPDDCDIWIVKSRFGFRKEYMNGEAALLIWDVESPDEDFEYGIIWPCGRGWEVRDSGIHIVHPKRPKFVKSSIYGRLIERVVGVLKVDMRSRGPATDARVWETLGFHIRRETLSFGKGILEESGGEIEHLMPVAFLGEKQTKRSNAVVQSPDGKVTGVLGEVEAKARQLPRLAFEKWALNYPALQTDENAEILASVLDDTDKGMWSRVHKTDSPGG